MAMVAQAGGKNFHPSRRLRVLYPPGRDEPSDDDAPGEKCQDLPPVTSRSPLSGMPKSPGCKHGDVELRQDNRSCCCCGCCTVAAATERRML